MQLKFGVNLTGGFSLGDVTNMMLSCTIKIEILNIIISLGEISYDDISSKVYILEKLKQLLYLQFWLNNTNGLILMSKYVTYYPKKKIGAGDHLYIHVDYTNNSINFTVNI